MRLFTHADVATFDPANPTARAILESQGKILAVGSVRELRDLASDTVRVEEIDCRGATIIPGLVDAHLHAGMYADTLADIDLRRVRSEHEAIEAVRAHARTLPEGVWVTGGRWDFNTWDRPEQPDRTLLDEAFPDRPVALWTIDYHTLWCNGAALRAAGIHDDTPSPRGGEIVRDEHGRPTGILREDAATLVERIIPVLPLEVRVDRLRKAQDSWLAEGLTGLHDIDGQATRETWEALRAAGEQRLRVVKYLRLEEFDWAKRTGWRTGRGDDWYVQGGLKLFSDGALGSHTSYMSSPFPHAAGEEPNHGIQIATEDVLRGQIAEALDRGISLAIHAIGDQANHHVLSALAANTERTVRAERSFGRVFRHRIEHAQFIQPADVARFAELGVVASMQPRHCISDLHLLDRLRPDESLAAYAWGDLAAAGATVAFGSDGPVEPANPFAAIYAAMTRADISGDPATTFQPERRISAYAAIEAHSAGAAYAAGLETRTGRISAGMAADFLVLDHDPLRGDGYDGMTGEAASEQALFEHAARVRDTRPLMTVVGGQVAHSR
ncbi:amidohydrolase [Brevibacterium sp. CS2]|uniref:amidohydrolase n=1 Tax=Brevibacterium sp. CS2 TaxID=2575923 RepID=UPI0010C7CB65|nr:amidohydrolase [Brevibacterium sp. CS2]QCP04341.1 amidohydrolase [Brevibacterium sp. CS2]